MIKRFGIVVAVVILASLFSGCTEMSADQIVQTMKEKQEGVKDFSATMVMSSSFAGKSQDEKAKMLSKTPGKSRIEYLEPEDTAGQVTVTDGTTLWMYDPKKNEVTKMEIPDVGGQQQMDYTFIKELLNMTEVSYQGTENFDERSVYRLSASPKETEIIGIKYNMLIDSETWMPLKMEMFDKDNNQIVSIEYRDIKFNTGIPDSEFEFKVPEGAKVVTQDMPVSKDMTLEEAKKAVNFTVLTPAYIPAGFSFESANVMEFSGKEIVSLLYKDSTKTLVITEQPKGDNPEFDTGDVVSINGAEGKLIKQPFGGTLLTWSSAGIDYMISSELDKEESIKVAVSMK